MQYMYTQLHWNKSTKDWLVWSHNNATKCVELYGNLQTVSQFFPKSVGHVIMSSKNWFNQVKGYSLLDQMTSRNLSTSSVEYVNVL